MSITTLLRETPRLAASGLYGKLVWFWQQVGDGPLSVHRYLQELGTAKGASMANGRRQAAACGRLGMAAVLVALACAVSQTATAQTTFISNTTIGGTNSNNTYNISSTSWYSQPFTTGSHADGYNISSVAVRLHNFGSSAISLVSTVFALREDSSGNPSGTDFAVLTNPATVAVGEGLYTLAAPSGTVLRPDTTYHVIGYRSAGATEVSWYRATLADGLDTGTAEGWSLPGINRRFQNNVWGSRGSTDAMQIQIIGSLAISSVSVGVPQDGDKVTTGDNAVFVLSRTGDASEALTVNVSWTNAATGLASTPSTTVDFAANSAEATVSLPSASLAAGATPVNVTLTVAAATGGEYQPGTPAAASVLVRPPNRPPDPLSPPIITGTLTVGETLTVDQSLVMDEDLTSTPTFARRWERADDDSGTNSELIASDLPNFYILQSADEGKHIRVVLSYTDEAGYDESIATAWTAAVAPAAALPDITVEAAAASVAGGEAAVFTLTRTGDMAETLVVNYEITGDGIQGNPSSVTTFQMNLPTIEVSVPTNTPAAGTNNQSVTLTIRPSGDSSYTVGTDSMATVTVTAAAPADLPVVTVRANVVNIERGGRAAPAVFTFTRTGGSATASLTVNVRVAGNSFADTRLNQVTFAAGQTTQQESIATNALDTGDSDTTGTVTVLPGTGYTVGASPGNAATIMIFLMEASNDATGMPAVTGLAEVGQTLMASRGTADDIDGVPTGDGVLKFRWQRETAPNTWTDIPGATGTSYNLVAADMGLRIRVALTFRDVLANDEELFSDPTAAVAAASGGSPLPAATVIATTATAVEPAPGASAAAANQLLFTVELSPAPAQSTTLAFTLGGTAIEGGDYTVVPVSKLLSFDATTTTQTIMVSALGDIVAEGASGETVTVTVGSSTATGTINEPATQIAIGTTTPAVRFEGGSTVVRFSFSSLSALAPAGGLDVEWRVIGSGSTGGGAASGRSAGSRVRTSCPGTSCHGTVTYAAGSTTLADPVIEAVFDTALPSGSDVQVQVKRPASAANLAVVPSSDVAASSQVVDSEWVVTGASTVPERVLPVVTVAAGAASVIGGENAVFTLTRTADTAGALPVTISVGGSGVSVTPQATTTFLAGSATVTVSVPTNALVPNAPSQSVTLTVSASGDNSYTVGSVSTATVTAEAPTLGFTVTATQTSAVEPAPGSTAAAANQLVFTVRVTPAPPQTTTQAFTLGGTAQNLLDYTVEPASLTLAFGPSTATRTITVSAIGDIVAEGASGETVNVTVDGTTSRDGTISDPPAQIAVSTTAPSFRSEADKTIVSFSFATLDQPAPAGGLEVEWRVAVGGSADSALGRSAGARARVTCSVGACGGTVTYPAGRTSLADSTIEAVFDTEAVADRDVQVQVRPTASAANFAVVPAEEITAANEQIVDSASGSDWIVAAVETIVLASPAALTHSVSSFGSTVAANFIASIWRRAELYLSEGTDTRAQIGGRSIDTRALTSGNAGQAVREVASLFGIETAAPEEVLEGQDYGIGYGGNLEDYRAWAGVPDSGDLAGRTSFALPVGEMQSNGVPFAIWGEFRTAAHESESEDGGSVDMELSGTHFGVDYRGGDSTLLGLSASTFSGETDYVADGGASSRLDSDITIFAPYILLKTASGLSVWTSLGIGEGMLSQGVGASPATADTSMQMFAAGIRHQIWNTDAGSMSIKGDTLHTSIETENASTVELSGIDVRSSRARLALEYADARTRESGNAVSHRFEMGVLTDSGDDGSGVGADIASEMRYVFPEAGLQFLGHASMLLLHSQAGQKEWGLGIGAIYDPGVAGRGMRLSLDPVWNTPRSDVAESMWNASSLNERTSAEASASLQARLGYGAGVLDEMAQATLYGETETASDEQRLRLGAELHGLDGPLKRLSLDIYGERKESRSATPVHAIMLESALRF